MPPLVLRVDPRHHHAAELQPAVAALRSQLLVAFPTETVYGLGADARSESAVRRVFAAKGRPADNPLIVHVADVEAAASVARLTPLARALAAAYWPGPLTLVLEARPGLPAAVTAGLATVAVRVPDHPVARTLLGAAGVPVAAPSANRSGRPSPTTAAHVLDDLSDVVDVVVDAGASPVGLESTVADATGTRAVVLRPGAVSADELEAEVAAGSVASPGTRHRHYAPECRVEVAPAGEGGALAAALASRGLCVGLVAFSPAPAGVEELAVVRDSVELARGLYGLLREAERRRVDVVVVEAVDESGVGAAVMDRLRRAAQA